MRVRVYPYKMSSVSGRSLAQALGVLRCKQEGSTFQARTGDVIINWGNSQGTSNLLQGTIINLPYKVSIACNKFLTFSKLLPENVSIPDFTVHQDVAQQWVNEGHRVYGRKTLTGHSGQGIVIFNEGDTVTNCPLYTKSTRARHEFRIHVMNSKVIDMQQKKKREGFDGGIVGIRNFANGWVFCRENIEVPIQVQEEAVKAVNTLGLDFGVVDVGWNQTENKAYIYEVNTAPGIEGTTLERYVQAFKENFLD